MEDEFCEVQTPTAINFRCLENQGYESLLNQSSPTCFLKLHLETYTLSLISTVESEIV